MASPSGSGLALERATQGHQPGMMVSNPSDPAAANVFFSFDQLGAVLSSPLPAGSSGLPGFLPVTIPAPYHPPHTGPYGRLPPLAHLNTDSTIYRAPNAQPDSRARTSSHPYAHPAHSPTHSRRDSANSDDSNYPPSPVDRRAHRPNNSISTNASFDIDDEPPSAPASRAKPKLGAQVAASTPSQAKSSSESITVLREMTQRFEFMWMASTGRCTSPAAASSSPVEQPLVVTFPPGGWFHVYDSEGEIWPWVNLNAWIKGQCKESRQCICAFQWFKNGKELGKKGLHEAAIWKRPAVLREHLAHCQKLEPSNPLVIVARWTRESDKLRGAGADTRAPR